LKKSFLGKGAKKRRKVNNKFLNSLNAKKMKANENANKAQGATATAEKGTANKINNRPSLTGKEAKQQESANPEKPAEAPKVEEAKVAEVKAGNSVTVDNQPANTAEHPEKQQVKADESKAEIRYIKPALNLEQTLKAVDSLHRKSLQRVNLIGRVKQLEAFEVKLTQENDELEENPYQGRKLIIEDDKKRQFVTTTPGLIRLVSQFIFDACSQKLAEIEAEIIFPNA
jgi:hypothetical protein